MNYKAILFDMDGTLVPMDNDVFTKGYFKELAKKLSDMGDKTAYEQVMLAVSDFEKGNLRLSTILAAMQ